MKNRRFIPLAILLFAAVLFFGGCRSGDGHTHEFSDYAVTVKSTCTTEGVLTASCTCGETQTKPLNPAPHDYNQKRICNACGTYSEDYGLVFQPNRDGTCSVEYSGYCTAERVEIPMHSPKGDLVTKIRANAFYGCDLIKEVVIPEGVTTIERYAFAHCTALVNLQMADSVAYIEYYAFYNCTALQSITFSSKLNAIRANAFQNCTALTEINLPAKDLFVAPTAFDNTAYLNSIAQWENGVLYLDRHLFLVKPEELPAHYEVKKGTVAIVANAFQNCTTLHTISFPESLIAIGSYAFLGCTALQTVGSLHQLQAIGHYAFQDCSSLTDALLPDTLESLGISAFDGCTGLAVFYIPDKPLSIGQDAFRGTPFYDTPAYWENGVLYFGVHLLSVNSAQLPKSYTIKEGTLDIAGAAFSGCKLDALYIPATVKLFGSGAFASSTIKDLYLSDLAAWCRLSFPSEAATPIGCATNAYFDNKLLTDLVISEEITEIGSYAFAGYKKLRSVTFHDGIKTIGTDAFRYCNGITDLYLTDPDQWLSADTKHIPNKEYYDLDFYGKVRRQIHLHLNGELLTHLDIPDHWTQLSARAFAICTSVTTMTIPENIQTTDLLYNYDEWLESVYYKGARILSPDGSHYPDSLFDPMKVYYYTGENTNVGGSYWCYDENGKIKKWHNCTPSNRPATCTAYQRCTDCQQAVAPALGHSFENGVCTRCQRADLSYAENADGTFTVIGLGSHDASILYIPETHNGKPVTAIGKMAFKNCTKLYSVHVPEGVTAIEDSAFLGCTHLAIIELPDSLVTVGSSAFEQCSALVSVTLPEGVTAIGENAFRSCDKLKSMRIPAGVTSIEPYTFFYCSALTALVLEEGLLSIGQSAFGYCTSLLTVELPASVTDIEKQAFQDCKALTAVHIADLSAWCRITFGDRYANPLRYARNLLVDGVQLQELVIPEGITSIDTHTFQNCAITSLVVPSSVVTIHDGAFENCKQLTHAMLRDGVTNLGTGVFNGCTSLISATLPQTLEAIPAQTFAGCTSLLSLTVPGGVTAIGTSAFYGCSSLVTVTLPEGVDTIERYAFANCVSLTSIQIPEGVHELPETAFQACLALTTIVLPRSLTVLTGYIFLNCNDITAIYYRGTAAEWDTVLFDYTGNAGFGEATRYFYSETAPTEKGNYWHYVDGVPTAW